MKLNILFNRPLGTCEVPNAPVKKPIAPVVAAALIAGGASILNGVGNLASQADANSANRDIAADTNKTNLQITQQQIEAARQQYLSEQAENRRLVQQQHDWEIANRDYENAYNSPSAQKQRFIAAGINPYLAMQGQGSVGSASASSSVGSPASGSVPNAIPAESGAPVQPLNFDAFGQGISDAARLYYQFRDSEREDYRLASDITFRKMDSQQKSLDYLLELRKHGVNEKFVQKQIDSLAHAMLYTEKEFDRQQSIDRFNQFYMEMQIESEKQRVSIEEQLAASKISLNSATIAQIANNIAVAKAEVADMQANGVSQREINRYVAARERDNAELVSRQLERDKRITKGNRRYYTDFMTWLSTPLKGLVSVGVR